MADPIDLTTPVSSTKPASVAADRSSHHPRGWGWLRVMVLIFLLAAASLFEPSVFQFAARQLLQFTAWRSGVEISTGRVEGALWRPVIFHNLRWSHRTPSGALLRLDVTKAVGEFSWRDLLSQTGGRWFRRLQLTGLTGKLEFSSDPDSGEPTSELAGDRRLPMPERLEATGVNFLIQAGRDSVRFHDGSCTISELEPGVIRANQIVIKQPWFTQTFRDVKGATAMQGQRVVVANLQLKPGIEVTAFSAQFAELLRGRLNADIQIAAFGGTIRAQAQELPRGQPAGFEAIGNFANIEVAPLATFLGLSEAAGGTIKEGRFTFRGSPRNLPRATVSVRLEAKNFQWESRQWDSLVLGATLLERKLQIPELELHQGHNHLSLNGDLAIPQAGTPWWQSEFSCNVAARIENLTELSALMLPEFKYAAGRVNIDGSVRGRNQQFNGTLIVSGSRITWRNAPIEELHAALRIQGNELQVSNIEVLNKDDYLRGRGVVNILGAKQYWGEVRGSVADLSTYAALLQRPILPEPLTGGGALNWSGEGSAKGHSGSFSARGEKLGTLGATKPMLHPLNAELEGTYAPGSIQFSRFALADEQSGFAAKVTVGGKTVTLQDIRLTHGTGVWLEGNAMLPLDLWHAWPNTSISTLLTDQVPGRVQLTARGLRLREASRLTGWKWPVEGVVNGTITAEGVLGSLKAQGDVTLSSGRIPLGWSGDALTDVHASVTVTGETVNVERFRAQHGSGIYRAKGQIDFHNVRDTHLKLTLQSDRATLPGFSGLSLQTRGARLAPDGTTEAGSAQENVSRKIDATMSLNLQIDGPASAAQVRGSAQILSIVLDGIPDLTAFWTCPALPEFPPLFQAARPPWTRWTFDIACIQETPGLITPGGGAIAPVLRLTGTGAHPVLTGSLTIRDASAFTGAGPMEIHEATAVFREENPANPTVDVRAAAQVYGEPVSAFATGPWSHLIRFFDAAPPVRLELVPKLLTGEAEAGILNAEGTSVLHLSAPALFLGDVPTYDWVQPPEEAMVLEDNGSVHSALPQLAPSPTP